MSVGRQLPPVQQFSSHIQGCSTYFQIPPRPLDCFLFSVGKLYRNIFLVLSKSSATSQFDKINHIVQFASEVQSAAQKHNPQFVVKPKNPSLICKMSKLSIFWEIFRISNSILVTFLIRPRLCINVSILWIICFCLGLLLVNISRPMTTQ